MDRPQRFGLLDVLAGVPGSAGVAGNELQVAAGHVEADGVTIDQVQGVCLGDLTARLADGDDQLDLVLIVLGRLGIGDDAAVRHDGLGPAGEEEGRFAVGILAHFTGVGGIVAADAEQATDRKTLARRRRGEDRGRRLEGQGHAFSSLKRVSLSSPACSSSRCRAPRSARRRRRSPPAKGLGPSTS